MNIIFVGQDNGQSRTLHLTMRNIVLAVGTLCALSILAIWGVVALFGIVTVDKEKVATVDREVIARWQHQLVQQSTLVKDAKAESARQIDALTLRMGELQARLLRLDALGERITQEAHLDASEFDFSSQPALGGPEAVSTEKSYQEEELTNALDRIESQIQDREKQLQILEALFVTQSLQSEAFIAGRPIKSGWLSSRFGWRTDPFTGKRAWHAGIDFAGKVNTDIVAVASGVVTWASDRYGYGNLVEVTHGAGLATRYGHAKEITVKVGDVVKKGQVVAKMGSTGRSTGPHVHFEVMKGDRQINPEKYILRASR